MRFPAALGPERRLGRIAVNLPGLTCLQPFCTTRARTASLRCAAGRHPQWPTQRDAAHPDNPAAVFLPILNPQPKTVGTLTYMAPEVLSTTRGGYDARGADVWSIGVCLYGMLTGAAGGAQTGGD